MTNKSKVSGTEISQLYIRDKVGSVVRPVKELKQFRKTNFAAGETKILRFQLTTEDLKFYNNDLRFDWEAGTFEVMVGGNSVDVRKASVIWSR